MSRTNIFLDTFPGLFLPPTKSFSLPSTATTADLLTHITSLLPPNLPASSRLIVTTTSNKQIRPSATIILSDLTTSPQCPTQPTILPLRLSLPLCGGKGGFGSQLRAAGGRMSSRKKRSQGDPNGSSRNLDGRRLRTITEAKNLAAYLATRPELERRGKEERRKHWEDVLEKAERRGEEIRMGKGASGRGGGVSEEWLADKEEVGDAVKEAVKRAMMGESKEKEDGGSNGSAQSDPPSEDDTDEDLMELDDNDLAVLNAEAEAGDADAIWVLKNQIRVKPPTVKDKKRFAGFDDEDDEFLSSSDDEGEEGEDGSKGKGKQNAELTS